MKPEQIIEVLKEIKLSRYVNIDQGEALGHALSLIDKNKELKEKLETCQQEHYGTALILKECKKKLAQKTLSVEEIAELISNFSWGSDSMASMHPEEFILDLASVFSNKIPTKKTLSNREIEDVIESLTSFQRADGNIQHLPPKKIKEIASALSGRVGRGISKEKLKKVIEELKEYDYYGQSVVSVRDLKQKLALTEGEK